jgi:hypothetical protein
MSVIVVGLVAAFVGPRLSSPQEKAAKAQFEYLPPAGFTEAQADAYGSTFGGGRSGVQRAWVHSELGAVYRPNITLLTTPKASKVDEPDLMTVARGMPAIFLQSQTTWTEVRHAMHVRPDGARVGVIVGDAEKGPLHYRMMQIVFPIDLGTAIVTASFPFADAARWEGPIEASIDEAKGVATLVSSPPAWTQLAWGLGAAVLAYLVLALRRRT